MNSEAIREALAGTSAADIERKAEKATEELLSASADLAKAPGSKALAFDVSALTKRASLYSGLVDAVSPLHMKDPVDVITERFTSAVEEILESASDIDLDDEEDEGRAPTASEYGLSLFIEEWT